MRYCLLVWSENGEWLDYVSQNGWIPPPWVFGRPKSPGLLGLRLNIARERAYNDDIRALTSSCPHLQYLNIAETSVAYQDIINIVLAWKKTMINLCLPHQLGFVLTLRSRAPNLPLILQFQTLIREMEQSEYLHVGHYKFHQADVDNRRPQVARLKSLFPNLVINHNPYSICPNTDDAIFHNRTPVSNSRETSDPIVGHREGTRK